MPRAGLVSKLPLERSVNPQGVSESSVRDEGFRSFGILLCSAHHVMYRGQSVPGCLIARNPRVSISLAEFLGDSLTFVTGCVTTHGREDITFVQAARPGIHLAPPDSRETAYLKVATGIADGRQ